MYKVIERYRGGCRLTPEYLEGTFDTIAEVKAFVNWKIPRSQASDWIVKGHGREVRASKYLETDAS